LLSRHRHCSLGISIALSALALVSLDILTPSRSVSHSSASASPLSWYRHPALPAPHSSVSVSLALQHCWYPASVSLSCLRTPIPNCASVSSSTGFISSLSPYNLSITAIPTHQPTSLSKHTIIPCGTELFIAIHRSLSATPRSLTNKFTLVISVPPQPRSQPVATVVCHGVKSVSRGLSLPTTYLPPPLFAQHLFNTDIYSTSLHTQADSRLFTAVYWLPLNYHVCPRRNPFHFPLYNSSISIRDRPATHTVPY
jgi:hypothetical protein